MEPTLSGKSGQVTLKENQARKRGVAKRIARGSLPTPFAKGVRRGQKGAALHQKRERNRRFGGKLWLEVIIGLVPISSPKSGSEKTAVRGKRGTRFWVVWFD